MGVTTRFAPSPTGFLHIGGVRTALYAWLYARHHQGRFILRIENTDQQRSYEQAEQVIIDGMRWLGLQADAPVIKQTDRLPRYQQLIKQLIDQGQAYYCHCSVQRLDKLRQQQKQQGKKPGYDHHCRHLNLSKQADAVVRLKSPVTGQVGFIDQVYGAMSVANKELDDLVIQRSNGLPTYNFAVVVDDIDDAISDVIRGDDHINNTFRQIHIYQALEQPLPNFAHTPMVLGNDGSKLSKRHGAISVLEYRQQGYLPEALLNYLLRLGWSCGDQEIFTRDEMIEQFNFGGMNKAAARFDVDKLNWINQHYIQQSEMPDLMEQIQWHLQHQSIEIDRAKLAALIDLFQDRFMTLVQFIEQINFFNARQICISSQDWQQYVRPNQAYLSQLYKQLQGLSCWQADDIMKLVKETSQQQQIKLFQLGMPLRLALTGSSKSPSFSEIAALLGKSESLKRLQRVCASQTNSMQ